MDFEHVTPTIKTINHLLIKAYFHYKQIEERKIKLEPKDILSYIKYIDMKPELPLTEKIILCIKFIPKFYLVIYYYISYIYSIPFKYKVNNIDTSIDYSKNIKEIYIKIGDIINDLYKRILNDECIINEKLINEFHSLLIKLVIIRYRNIDFYQYKEYLSDFDFCINIILDNNENKIESDIFYSLEEMDRRWLFLSHYKYINKYNKKNIF